MKKKKDDIMILALKRARKESRDQEIELYGHPISFNKVFKSKKIYSRKSKQDWRVDLPFISS